MSEYYFTLANCYICTHGHTWVFTSDWLQRREMTGFQLFFVHFSCACIVINSTQTWKQGILCSPVCRIGDVSLVRHVSGYTCIKVTAAVAVGPWLLSGTCILWILLASTSGLFFLQHGQRFTQKYTHRHRYMLSKHSLNVLITPIHTDIFSDPVKKAHTCKKK